MADDVIAQMWDRTTEALADAESAAARATVALGDLRIAVRLAQDRVAALQSKLREIPCPTTNGQKQR